MAFMTIDFLGGFFSVLSLAFKPSVDPLLAFSYSGVVVRFHQSARSNVTYSRLGPRWDCHPIEAHPEPARE